jgi:hypothetical protein
MAGKPGSTTTRVVGAHAGVNEGDTVQFKVAKGGKEFPVRIVNDRGAKNKTNVARINRRKNKDRRVSNNNLNTPHGGTPRG